MGNKTPGSDIEIAMEDFGASTLAAFVKRYRHALARDPDVIAALFPDAEDDASVVDMQRFVVDRLRGEIAEARAREAALQAMLKDNLNAQAIVHQAVLRLMAAQGAEHLVEIVVHELPVLLGLEAVTLSVESEEPVAPPGSDHSRLRILPPGSLAELLSPEEDAHIIANGPAPALIFGRMAPLLSSSAMIRLTFGRTSPSGLLSFGAAASHAFDPDQGTELLTFLARSVEAMMRQWLDLQPPETP